MTANRSTFLCAILMLALSGCAAHFSHQKGRDLVEMERYEEGLAALERAATLDPDNREYRTTYLRARDNAVHRLLAQARLASSRAQWEQADTLYERATRLDPSSEPARVGLASLARAQQHRQWIEQAAQLADKQPDQAIELLRKVLRENPTDRAARGTLRKLEDTAVRPSAAARMLAAPRTPVSIEFRSAPLRMVFELLSKQSGLNFIFDKEVNVDAATTVFVRNSTLEDAIQFILVTNQLEKKILNESTLLIYPNNANKLKDYQELVTRSFYVTNADVRQTANLIKTIVKTKDVFVDERVNLLVIRDTPQAVRMAERLVTSQDLAAPEVMLEVEVMEVSSSLLSEIGLRYPEQVSFSLIGGAGTAGTMTLPEWKNRGSDNVRLSVTDPALILNLKNQDGRTNLLANPRIRVRNREKAKIHIGDKVPVITTSTTSNGVIAESANYLEVGLKLDVEPNILLDNEVGIKVALEVSNIVKELRSPTGSVTYQVGTRSAATHLQLKDGETQVLAGLISDEDRKTASRFPVLGNLPLLGRLFSTHGETATKTEIVLLITPRVVRNVLKPDMETEEFLSGTESAIGAPPLRLRHAPAAATTDTVPAAAPLPENPNEPTSAQPPAAAPSAEPRVILSSIPASDPRMAEMAMSLSGTDKAIGAIMTFAFDPKLLRLRAVTEGAALSTDKKNVQLKYVAPDRSGRVTISLAREQGLPADAQWVRVQFERLLTEAGAVEVRSETVTLQDRDGQLIPATLPAPVLLGAGAAKP